MNRSIPVILKQVMVKVIFKEPETVILYSGDVVPNFYHQMGAFTINPFRIQGKKKTIFKQSFVNEARINLQN